MPDIAVSLVVPTRGGRHRLPALFDALATQDLFASWEAVVVVDGDIDGSSDVVDRGAARLPVRRITFPENRGRSAALNAGFDDARGHVLVRCDDDLIPRADYLTRHMRAHEAATVGAVGLYRNVYPDTTYARIYGRAWDRRFRDEAYGVDPGRAWRYWAGNVSVTRDTWERIGPYDTAFRAYGWEDVDWGYRLYAAGIPIVLDRGLETEHRIAATTTAMRAQRAYYSGAARQRFESIHGPVLDQGSPDSSWDRVAEGIARLLDEGRAGKLGSAIDHGAPFLPGGISGTLVALTIDAAARAGRRTGSTSGAI